ncbi:uncharacterized protein LY89DRAFT_692070 [Mollisia scopiformis]|uniref:Uncharacterized protein n=1 Tax=Mollisia scopiformis TaxID=149040 RepID=A0A132B3M8_MOLSC|nr:uncharacterized protein LY89DRAFT_692070 [Mollisia scopiformis]KUJ06990.1 hypothetical protein LY89DRAFT_692070 [Mollisia scopiformis]
MQNIPKINPSELLSRAHFFLVVLVVFLSLKAITMCITPSCIQNRLQAVLRLELGAIMSVLCSLFVLGVKLYPGSDIHQAYELVGRSARTDFEPLLCGFGLLGTY